MIDDIIKKLEIDSNCELSVEELKTLYEIDTTIYMDLNSYTEKRNNYEDFCKIFGKKCVARTSKDVNENTICYIGDLLLEYNMPTYNLRYVYGSIDCWFDEIKNLENLEVVYENVDFDYLKDYKNLDNLRKVGKKFSLNYVEKGDFYSLEYVNTLLLVGVECAKDIIMPEYVNILWLPLLNTNKGLVLPKVLKQLYILDEKILDNLELPESLELIQLGGKKIELKNKIKKK